MIIYFKNKRFVIPSVAILSSSANDFFEYQKNIFSQFIEKSGPYDGQLWSDQHVLFEIFQEEVEELIANSMLVELSNKLCKVFNKEPLPIIYIYRIVEAITNKIRLNKKNTEQVHKLVVDFILYIFENYYDKKKETQLLATESLVMLTQFVNGYIFLNKQEIEFLVKNQYITESLQITIDKSENFKLDSLLRQVRKYSSGELSLINGYYELNAVFEAIRRSRLTKVPKKTLSLVSKELINVQRRVKSAKLHLQNIIADFRGLDPVENKKLKELDNQIELYYLNLNKYIQKVTMINVIICNLTIRSSDMEVNAVAERLGSLGFKKYSFKTILKKWNKFETEFNNQNLELMDSSEIQAIIDEYVEEAIDFSTFKDDFNKFIQKLLSDIRKTLSISDDNDALYLDIKKKLQQSKEDCLEYAKNIDMRLKNFLENRIY